MIYAQASFITLLFLVNVIHDSWRCRNSSYTYNQGIPFSSKYTCIFNFTVKRVEARRITLNKHHLLLKTVNTKLKTRLKLKNVPVLLLLLLLEVIWLPTLRAQWGVSIFFTFLIKYTKLIFKVPTVIFIKIPIHFVLK